MREIFIDLSSDNYLQRPKAFGGYEGEHNETVLKVKLPKRMIGIQCSGYRFDFQTSEDEKISSPLIPVSKLDDDIISLRLIEQLTITGELFFNIAAIVLDGDTISSIAKTNGVFLYMSNSPKGKSTPIDPNGYKDELLEMVDNRIVEIGAGQTTENNGEIFNDYENNIAGGKCFSILSIDESSGNYVLDSVDGIEIGDIYSIKIGANYDFAGEVYDVLDNNTIHVSNTIIGTTTDLSDAVMWFPYKPQIGTQVNGGAEHAEGYATTAINWGSHSEGFNTLAEGKYSHTENHSTVAGYASHAEGQETYALGQWSHTQGFATAVFGDYGFAFGRGLYPITNYFNKLHKNITAEELKEKWVAANRKFLAVYGTESTSGGKNNLVLGKNSFSIGEENLIEGNNSKALGAYSVVSGNNSTDIGHGNNNNGDKNFSAGTGNTIYGINSTVIGYNNGIDKNNWKSMLVLPGGEEIENGISDNYFNNLHIEGKENKIISTQDRWPISDDSVYLDNLHIEGIKNRIDIGLSSKIKNTHIEGCNNSFIGNDVINSHFEGVGNNFDNLNSTEYRGEPPLVEASHVEGYCNNVKGHIYQTHIEGANNKVGEENADGTYKNKVICSHIEGQNNTVKSSNYAHIQGASNKVESSNGGHVGGWNNTVKGDCAFAHGHKLQTNAMCQFVIGRYNDYKKFEGATNPEEKALFIIGNGTDDAARSNAFEVYHDGHAEIQKQGETEDSVATKAYVDNQKDGVVNQIDNINNQIEDINNYIGNIETALESIIALQEALIGRNV